MGAKPPEGDDVETQIKRRIAIGAAGVTILAGGGGAYALADQSGGNGPRAFENDLAKRLGVSAGRLRAAQQAAFFDRIDADVKAGRLTQKQADQIKSRARQHRDAGPPGPPGPGGPRHGGPMEALQAAAKYLGLTDAQLRQKLQSGKSLAAVAKDENKSVDGLKAAIKDAIVKDLDQHVDQMVNRSGPPGPPGRMGHFRGGSPPPGGPPPGF